MTAITDASPRGVAATRERKAKSSYRADLQGLRATASLLVAVYHTWIGAVSGGVDVFFVLTGLLMTGTLLGNVGRTGTIDFRNYITRLAGRLFPLAGLVLVAVTLMVVVFIPQFQWSAMFRDIFASATYWQNWHLAQQATDYLAQGGAKSPVQHFWAMSVQGQFYLIWAAVVALALMVSRRDKRFTLEGWLFLLVMGVSVLSAAWAIYGVIVNPIFHYFDTFARLWEFGLGALLFILMKGRVLSTPVRWVAGISGLALLLTAGSAPSDWHYPGPVALWPVAGAVLLVLSHQPGAPNPGPVTRLLGSRPLEWLGGYSYGIYLWSWPILMAYFLIFPERQEIGLVGGTVGILLSVIAAWISIRALDTLDAAWKSRVSSASFLSRLRMPLATALVPLMAIVGLALPAAQRAILHAQIEAHGGIPGDSFSTVEELQAEIKLALASTSMPTLSPGFGMDGRAREWVEDDCATVDPSTLDSCRYDDGPSSHAEIFVIGDSQATSGVPGIRAAADGRASVQLATREMCPFSTTDVTDEWQGIDSHAACIEHNEWVLSLIDELEPDLVVLSFGVWHGSRVEAASDPYEGMAMLAEGASGYLARLSASGVRTIWLDPPPSGLNTERCAQARTASQFQEFCRSPILYEQLVRVALFQELSVATGVPFVETLSWFCDEESLECPGIMRNMAVTADGAHLTWGMAKALAPLLATELGLEQLPQGPRE